MKRVFVADDDFILTKIYQMHFKRNDIEGTFFTKGAALLEKAAESPPDAVLLDYELPDLHGPEVMKLLREIPGCETLPVVFVTARANAELEVELKKQGARKVLGKPFSPDELVTGLVGV